MSFGPPKVFTSGLHPPPSFWSTSATKQTSSTNLNDDRAPRAGARGKSGDSGSGIKRMTAWQHRNAPPTHRKAGGGSRVEGGGAGARTLCSLLRQRRCCRRKTSPGAAVAAGMKRRRRRRPRLRSRGSEVGGLPRQSSWTISVDGDAGVLASAAGGEGGGNDSEISLNSAPAPSKAVSGSWGIDALDPWHGLLPLPPPPARSPGSARPAGPPPPPLRGTRGGEGKTPACDSPEIDLKRRATWMHGRATANERDCEPDCEQGDEADHAAAPLHERTNKEQAAAGTADDICLPGSFAEPSPKRGAAATPDGGTVGSHEICATGSTVWGTAESSKRGGAKSHVGGTASRSRGPEAGVAFLEIQRDLLKRLERLFVSIADERRRGLVVLKLEEDAWKAAAMDRAREDLRAAEGGDLEEQVRERVAEKGPGAAAMRAAGLVRVGAVGDDADSDDAGADVDPLPQSTGFGRRDRRGEYRGEWRLPGAVVEHMRRDFAAKIDREISEVLKQENKALLEERAEVAAKEGARTRRELRELSDRLTNDGRDALAALQRELEEEEEARLAVERARLRGALECALERERKRLVTERKLAIVDLRDASRRESSQQAASLREQAERFTSARRGQAVRLLDQAAGKARARLDALLQAQQERALLGVRHRGSSERQAAIKRAREGAERRCLKELQALAKAASKKNEAWLRVVLRDLRHALEEGVTAQAAAAEAEGLREQGKAYEAIGEGGSEDGKDVLAPTLQLRAVEASEDCARLGRRLVELIMNEAEMRLRDSGFDSASQKRGPELGAVCSGGSSMHNNSSHNGSSGSSGSSSNNDDSREIAQVNIHDTFTPATTHKHNSSSTTGTSNNYSSTNDPQRRAPEATSGTDCQSCMRLARANVELSRVLDQAPAAAGSHGHDDGNCETEPNGSP